MTDRDAILARLHAARRELEAAEALVAGEAPSDLQEIATARASLGAAIDAINSRAFAEGTTRPLKVKRPVKIRKRKSDDS